MASCRTMKASHWLRCGASWFDKLTMKRFLHFRSGSSGAPRRRRRSGRFRQPVRALSRGLCHYRDSRGAAAPGGRASTDGCGSIVTGQAAGRGAREITMAWCLPKVLVRTAAATLVLVPLQAAAQEKQLEPLLFDKALKTGAAYADDTSLIFYCLRRSPDLEMAF